MWDIVMLIISVIIVISFTVMTDFITVLNVLAGLDPIANLDKSAFNFLKIHAVPSRVTFCTTIIYINMMFYIL